MAQVFGEIDSDELIVFTAMSSQAYVDKKKDRCLKTNDIEIKKVAEKPTDEKIKLGELPEWEQPNWSLISDADADAGYGEEHCAVYLEDPLPDGGYKTGKRRCAIVFRGSQGLGDFFLDFRGWLSDGSWEWFKKQLETIMSEHGPKWMEEAHSVDEVLNYMLHKRDKYWGPLLPPASNLAPAPIGRPNIPHKAPIDIPDMSRWDQLWNTNPEERMKWATKVLDSVTKQVRALIGEEKVDFVLSGHSLGGLLALSLGAGEEQGVSYTAVVNPYMPGGSTILTGNNFVVQDKDDPAGMPIKDGERVDLYRSFIHYLKTLQSRS